jgi:predicted outer membrane repeat protein
VCLLLAGVMIPDAHAATTITVDTTDGGLNTSDGHCSLYEAIDNANNDAASIYPECLAGSGADTIVFANALGTATITLSAALPGIGDADGLTIDGGGDITLDGNAAFSVLVVFGLATLQDITITHGLAQTGGGVFLAGNLTILRSTLIDNDATGWDSLDAGGGGVFMNTGSTLTVRTSTFVGNHTVAQGGAIYNYKGTLTIANSTFTANDATGSATINRGGAVFQRGDSFAPFPTTTIQDSTFWMNSTSVNTGGAVHTIQGTLNLSNTILANSGSSDDCHTEGTPTIAGNNNLIQDASPACGLSNGVNGNVIGVDPGLGNLTGSPAYYPLKITSPAIDAGNNGLVAGGLSTDQAGNSRLADNALVTDSGIGSPPIVDIGSIENQFVCPASNPLHVDVAVAGGDDSGDSWANAFDDLQAGLFALGCPGVDELWVADGIYRPGPARGSSFRIPPAVRLYGGFAGTEAALAERDPLAHLSILSGDIEGNDSTDLNGVLADPDGIVGLNNYHVVQLDGTMGTPITATTLLDGFTITAGWANGSVPDLWGGGLYCKGSGGGSVCSPTLQNLTFSGNGAGYGGAMISDAQSGISSPTLVNVTFTGNRSTANGGAMFNLGYLGNSSPTLKNVTFSGNIAAADGGAIYDYGFTGTSSPALTNVTFNGNSAGVGYSGGAIYNRGDSGTSAPILKNVILWGDSASTGPEIYNFGIGAAPNISFSIVQGGCGAIAGAVCGANNLSSNPMLGPLQNNGGSTKTMALPSGSPAIEAASNAVAPPTDQRGLTRPQGPLADIGAYEVLKPKPMPAQGATVCVQPNIGVRLLLSALTRAASGNFNPASVTLLVDGINRTSAALSESVGSGPSSLALIHYKPPAALSAGAHSASFTYPTEGGNMTLMWSFSASGAVTCPTSANLDAPLSSEGAPTVGQALAVPDAAASDPGAAATASSAWQTPYRRLIIKR